MISVTLVTNQETCTYGSLFPNLELVLFGLKVHVLKVNNVFLVCKTEIKVRGACRAGALDMGKPTRVGFPWSIFSVLGQV